MILFDQEKRTVKITNSSVEYIVYINPDGYLETIYLGKPLRDFDVAAVRDVPTWCDDANIYFPESKREEHPQTFGTTPLEISPHGRRDKRGAPIICKRPNGSFATDFLYVSHEIYDGIKQLSGLPSAKGGNCQTIAFLLKERTRDLFVKHYITIFDDCVAIVKNYEIINRTGENVNISRAMSMQLDLNNRDYSLVHFPGRWANERNAFRNAVLDGVQEVASNLGATSAEESSFVYLQGNGADYAHGEVIGFNLIYSGNFKFRTYSDFNRGTHITYGINDEDFSWLLEDGESFTTPQAVICYSNDGIDGMSRQMHDFVRNHIVSYRHDKEYKPILFNSWEGCSFDFSTESILAYIDNAATIGSELFVLDDGWFGRRNNDCDGLGDWRVNTDKIDLGKVIDHCHEAGMKFGIWFEPEMLNPKSDLYQAHPDYALQEDGEDVFLSRHQMHLDMTRDDVVENIYHQMTAILDAYPIDYIKWDYNRRVYEHYSQHLGAQRQGEVYHRITLGYYKLISRIVARYPDIMIEGCAGGGARFDLGTLCYCPQIWTSDESNPARRCITNFNTSLGYPLSVMGTHVNDCELFDYRAKGLFALFGTYGYEMNPNHLSGQERQMLIEIAELYKKYHKDVIENGDLYHLANPSDGQWYILQCVSKDRSISLVLKMNLMCHRDRPWFLKLRGLDPEKQYKNSINGKVYYGDFYMNVGINLTRDRCKEFSCDMIILEEAC